MTQLDSLSQALVDTSLHSDAPSDVSPSPTAIAVKSPRPPTFASALRSGQASSPALLSREAASPQPVSASPASASPSSSSLPMPRHQQQQPPDDTILQAMRKRDDRIFFSQHENHMSAFVRDPSRSKLELAPMNAYQRLLVHRCADQFHLDHHLDRATQCITLTKTPLTSHPPALLSLRAREHITRREGLDPVDAARTTPIDLASAAPSPGAASPAAPDSSASSPYQAPAAGLPTPSPAPKAAFKIMRRDPSSSRNSRHPNDPSASNSDSEKATAVKARKDMTLEEREASYKAARARIFGDLASADSTSPTSSTSQLGHAKDNEGGANDTKPSPASSAASSPVASISGARSATKKKASSSTSSAASQDGSNQRPRASRKAGSSHTSDGLNDDLDFCRALPPGGPSISHMAAAPPMSSPLALPAHAGPGYFGSAQPLNLQQSHSNPNLRSRAPSFHPAGSSTPTYMPGGALAAPGTANYAYDYTRQLAQQAYPQAQRTWQSPRDASENDAFPALPGAAGQGGQNGFQAARQANGAMQVPAGAQRRSLGGQEAGVNGVDAWAHHASTHIHGMAGMQRPAQAPPAAYPQATCQQGAINTGFSSNHAHPGPAGGYINGAYAGSGSRNSSRASSQRGGTGGGRSARDDAVSVGSVSSATSSRSASFSGVSANGSSTPANPATNNTATPKPSAISHPSLPARPSWIGAAKSTADRAA